MVIDKIAKAQTALSEPELRRLSGDQDGVPRQHRVIESWAKKNKQRISEWIEDLGVSGTLAFADRPELSKLLANIYPAGIFVVEKAKTYPTLLHHPAMSGKGRPKYSLFYSYTCYLVRLIKSTN